MVTAVVRLETITLETRFGTIVVAPKKTSR
jgi:hypothetical protein